MGETSRCPALDPNRDRIPDYQATGREPGHDGNRPVFVETKDFVDASGKREKVDGPTNINSNRIEMLHARSPEHITDRCLAAANRLAKDWELSLIMPTASSVMVGNGSGGGDNLPNDVKVAAMRRYGDAREACGVSWGIIEAVVCRNLRVDEAASKLRIHPRRAMGRLEVGLDILAKHYGL